MPRLGLALTRRGDVYRFPRPGVDAWPARAPANARSSPAPAARRIAERLRGRAALSIAGDKQVS
jgi:hypothetical protein